MRFAVAYITLKLKELFRSKIYIGFAVFMLLLAFGMALLLPHVDQSSPYTLAILDEHNTKLGEQVVSVLERDGGYRLRICTDRRELEMLVLSGEVLCGYDFDEKADERIQKGRYIGLVDSFYREKSPAAALCDEAICGAIFEYLSPSVAASYLEQNKLADEKELERLEDSFTATILGGNMMKITLLGAEGKPMETESGSAITSFLYSIFCSLTAVFAITTAFYTHSIDKSLVFAGQRSALVGLCCFLSYSVSYLIILSAVHLVVGGFMPALLADARIVQQVLLTAAVGGLLQMFSRRYLSPAVLPLLPFAAVLMVAATSL